MVPPAYLSLQVQYCTPLSRAREVAERIASQVAKRQRKREVGRDEKNE